MDCDTNSKKNSASFENIFEENIFNSQSNGNCVTGSSSISQSLSQKNFNDVKFLDDSSLVHSISVDLLDPFQNPFGKRIKKEFNSKASNLFSFVGVNCAMSDVQNQFSSFVHPTNVDLPSESRDHSPPDSSKGKSMNADFSGEPLDVTLDNNQSMGETHTKGEKTSEAKLDVVKGQWTPDEDRLLLQLVEELGEGQWSHIANIIRGRVGKQCRERWHNHLKSNIKKGNWSEEEDMILIQAHKEMGNKWAGIAKRLPGRTENTIKNHWNATKRKRLAPRIRNGRATADNTLLQNYINGLGNSNINSDYNSTDNDDEREPEEENVFLKEIVGTHSNPNSGPENYGSILKDESEHLGLAHYDYEPKVIPKKKGFMALLLEGNVDDLNDDDGELEMAAVATPVEPDQAQFEARRAMDFLEILTETYT